MNLWAHIKARFSPKEEREHLRRGKLGERAAKKHLQKAGLKFLTANFRSAQCNIHAIEPLGFKGS